MSGENDGYKTSIHPTVFHELLNSDAPDSEKTLRRLLEEAQTVVGAGTITTAHILSTISYHVLANPPVLEKLKAELCAAMPTPNTKLSLQQLERLPYLSACISEGLRVGYGVSGRLMRAAPDRELHFQDSTIPRGTHVGMSTVLIHDNPYCFPDPYEYRPERWLEKESASRSQK